MTAFSAYGRLAKSAADPHVAVARHPFQAEALEHAVEDVFQKLEPGPSDSLLEIGFGTGTFLLPLARHVREAVGMDQEAYVERLKPNAPSNVRLVEGKWPRDRLEEKFDRILVYSVLHYLDTRLAALAFFDACLESLALGGSLLVGDLPNEDAAERFQNSRFGRRFETEWRRRVDESAEEFAAVRSAFDDVGMRHWRLGDRFVLELVTRARGAGLEAYVLPQGPELPFGHTREDVLVRRREA